MVDNNLCTATMTKAITNTMERCKSEVGNAGTASVACIPGVTGPPRSLDAGNAVRLSEEYGELQHMKREARRRALLELDKQTAAELQSAVRGIGECKNRGNKMVRNGDDARKTSKVSKAKTEPPNARTINEVDDNDDGGNCNGNGATTTAAAIVVEAPIHNNFDNSTSALGSSVNDSTEEGNRPRPKSSHRSPTVTVEGKRHSSALGKSDRRDPQSCSAERAAEPGYEGTCEQLQLRGEFSNDTPLLNGTHLLDNVRTGVTISCVAHRESDLEDLTSCDSESVKEANCFLGCRNVATSSTASGGVITAAMGAVGQTVGNAEKDLSNDPRTEIGNEPTCGEPLHKKRMTAADRRGTRKKSKTKTDVEVSIVHGKNDERDALRGYEAFSKLPKGTGSLLQVVKSSAGISGWCQFARAMDAVSVDMVSDERRLERQIAQEKFLEDMGIVDEVLERTKKVRFDDGPGDGGAIGSRRGASGIHIFEVLNPIDDAEPRVVQAAVVAGASLLVMEANCRISASGV